MSRFSIPLCPFLSDEDFAESYLPFISDHKDYIRSIYVTTSIPPFERDAMGMSLEMTQVHRERLKLIDELGIALSATFNNTSLPATPELLKVFIENYAPLYHELNIRMAVIPYIHWVRNGNLREHFPDLLIKNTVLNRVRSAQEFWNFASAGYDSIIIESQLLRDFHGLAEIRRARDRFGEQYGKYIPIAILGNEKCEGQCAFKAEHYTYGFFRDSEIAGAHRSYGRTYARANCIKCRPISYAENLKVANIPPWLEDIEDMLKMVDIIKLHGRSNVAKMNETIGIVRDYAAGKAIISMNSLCTESIPEILSRFEVPPERIHNWRKAIKTCRFECWQCDICVTTLTGSRSPG